MNVAKSTLLVPLLTPVPRRRLERTRRQKRALHRHAKLKTVVLIQIRAKLSTALLAQLSWRRPLHVVRGRHAKNRNAAQSRQGPMSPSKRPNNVPHSTVAKGKMQRAGSILEKLMVLQLVNQTQVAQTRRVVHSRTMPHVSLAMLKFS